MNHTASLHSTFLLIAGRPPSTAQTRPKTKGPLIKQLWQVVIDSDDPEEAVYCSVRALHTFACKATPALEHSLDIIAQAFTDLPEPTEFPAGKGAEGAFDILAWWFIEWSGRFKGPAYSTPSEQSRHCKVDASHTHDSTNIYPDLSDTPIEEISRLEFIVAMAIQGAMSC